VQPSLTISIIAAGFLVDKITRRRASLRFSDQALVKHEAEQLSVFVNKFYTRLWNGTFASRCRYVTRNFGTALVQRRDAGCVGHEKDRL
jgi:hypothetical protein